MAAAAGKPKGAARGSKRAVAAATGATVSEQIPSGQSPGTVIVRTFERRALAANPRNARIHSEEQVTQLAASITEFGWTNPLLVDEAGTIIAGHGRLLAAGKLGLEEVPCIVIPGLSDDQKRALTLADNRLAENAAWDFGLLAAELNDLQAAAFDMNAIGFSQKELDDLLGRAREAVAPTGFQEFDESIKTEHRCPKCGYEWNGG